MPSVVLVSAWPCVAARDENLTDAITTCTQRYRGSGQWLQSRDAFRPVPWDNFSSAIDGMRDVLWSRPGQFIPAKPDRHQTFGTWRYLCTLRRGGKDRERSLQAASWRWHEALDESIPEKDVPVGQRRREMGGAISAQRFRMTSSTLAPLAPLEPAAFAQMVRARSLIHFLGDSHVDQMAVSLVGLLAPELPLGTFAELTMGGIQVSWIVSLARGGRLRYDSLWREGRIEETLSAARLALNHSRHPTRNKDAPRRRIVGSEPVVVLSNPGRGSLVQLVACHRASANAELDAARSFAEVVRAGTGGQPVVFISRFPGHPGCVSTRGQPRYTRPLHSNASSQQSLEAVSTADKGFCWDKNALVNCMLVSALSTSLGERFHWIDAERLTQLRADGHSQLIPPHDARQAPRCCDCGHYCVPGGPVETYNDLLHRLLDRLHLTGV